VHPAHEREGAPALGCVAAYGFALSAREKNFPDAADALDYFRNVENFLAKTRPTAVNLFWALERMFRTAKDEIRSWKKGNGKGRNERLREILEKRRKKYTGRISGRTAGWEIWERNSCPGTPLSSPTATREASPRRDGGRPSGDPDRL